MTLAYRVHHYPISILIAAPSAYPPTQNMKQNPLLLKAFVLRLIAACTSAIVLFTAQQASAAEKIWNGGGADDSWETAGNWTGGVPANSTTTDTASFGTSSRYSIYLGTGNRSINGITFDSATSYNLQLFDSDLSTSRQLAVGAGGITVTSGNHTITGAKPGSGTAGALRLNSGTFNIASGSSLTFDTKINSPSAAAYIKTGAGTLVLNANNSGGSGWNYTAGSPFAVSQGTLRLAASGVTGNSGNSFTVTSGATLEVAASGAYGANNSTLRLSGTGVSGVGALYATATTAINSGSGSGVVLEANSSIGVTSGQTLTLNMPVSGGFALEKSGAGTLTLTNTNTYNGSTSVSAGTLLVNGSIAAGSVLVDASSTLGGNGTINGATTVNGLLAPGNSPGILTFNDTLALAGNTTLEIDGVTTRGTDFDGVNTVGLLTYGGGLTFDFGTTLSGNQTFDLFQIGGGGQTGNFISVALSGNYSGNMSLSGGNWTLTDGGGNNWSFSQATGDLTFIAVPEPATIAILGVGVACLGLTIARRRNLSGDRTVNGTSSSTSASD